MTRFAREWNGELGAFWQKNAHEEAARLLAQRNNIEVEEDGAAKWRSNGSYLRNHRTTTEERAEMEAAFGKGTTVVNIITGEKIKL